MKDNVYELFYKGIDAIIFALFVGLAIMFTFSVTNYDKRVSHNIDKNISISQVETPNPGNYPSNTVNATDVFNEIISSDENVKMYLDSQLLNNTDLYKNARVGNGNDLINRIVLTRKYRKEYGYDQNGKLLSVNYIPS